MSHRILITGGSGYLGGTILARLGSTSLPPYSKIYALVRTEDQANAVQQYGVEPLIMNLQSEEAIEKSIVDNKISIIFHLIDPWGAHSVSFIKALSLVKKSTGQDVHFLFTTGAKLFSAHADAPTSQPLLDTDPRLYDIQKGQKPQHPLMNMAVAANNTVIETAEALGVKSYIFAPCIVYGAGEGFGNKISIQTVAIVKAAKRMRRVYKVDEGRPTWPVSHVLDTVSLYFQILRAILEGKDIGYGKNGYFLAASGSVAWDDLYSAMAKGLKKRGVIDDVELKMADSEALSKMGEAFQCPPELVPLRLGGMCTFTADHGRQIGWTPKFPAEDILDKADEEVEIILNHLKE